MVANKLDLSLDDIIKDNKKSGRGGNRGRGGRGRGGFRGNRGPRGGVGQRQNNRGGGSNFGRNGNGSFGGGIQTGGSGKLVVKNLHFGVSDSDIRELFSQFGNLRRSAIHYDNSGRSMGVADVHFDRKGDAQKAMQQYNGVPLDGRAMNISFADGAPMQASRPRQFNNNRNGGGRGGQRGGRGRGGRGGGRGGRREDKPTPTAEELDSELDSYLAEVNK